MGVRVPETSARAFSATDLADGGGEGIVTLDGAAATVAWVRTVPGQADRYNLTVAQDHTYAVGASRAVVHNVCTQDIRQNPQRYAHERAQELQRALPAGSRGRVTMAVGVVRQDEELRVMIGTSEPRGQLRTGVEDLISLTELGYRAGGDAHAEVNILETAQIRGAEVIAIGAGRDICEACEAAIIQAAGQDAIASPTRSGFIPAVDANSVERSTKLSQGLSRS